MNINLIINYYTDSRPERQAEIEYCLIKNIQNPLINSIILLINEDDLRQYKHTHPAVSPKLRYVIRDFRPTYNYYFGVTHLYDRDINIISNADIYFNDSLQLVKDYYSNPLYKNHCMALSRWDEDYNGQIKHFDRPDSQDSWIFMGKAPLIPDANFTTGQAGCDNKIAYLIEAYGHKIINPSKSIKSIHVHNSGIRNYRANMDRVQIKPPFRLVETSVL
jgi:hypothetical protein